VTKKDKQHCLEQLKNVEMFFNLKKTVSNVKIVG